MELRNSPRSRPSSSSDLGHTQNLGSDVILGTTLGISPRSLPTHRDPDVQSVTMPTTDGTTGDSFLAAQVQSETSVYSPPPLKDDSEVTSDQNSPGPITGEISITVPALSTLSLHDASGTQGQGEVTGQTSVQDEAVNDVTGQGDDGGVVSRAESQPLESAADTDESNKHQDGGRPGIPRGTAEAEGVPSLDLTTQYDGEDPQGTMETDGEETVQSTQDTSGLYTIGEQEEDSGPPSGKRS